MKFQVYKWLALVAVLISLVSVVTDVTAKKPVKPDHAFTAFSEFFNEVGIDSYSADHDWQIVFRHAYMDISQFKGSDADGVCWHDPVQGIVVLKPKSKKTPEVARLEYWFQSELESGGETVTHLFVMEGTLDQDDWLPSGSTDLIFNYWEVGAENKWAQRHDCAGGTAEGEYPDPPWTVTVTRN